MGVSKHLESFTAPSTVNIQLAEALPRFPYVSLWLPENRMEPPLADRGGAWKA